MIVFFCFAFFVILEKNSNWVGGRTEERTREAEEGKNQKGWKTTTVGGDLDKDWTISTSNQFFYNSNIFVLTLVLSTSKF